MNKHNKHNRTLANTVPTAVFWWIQMNQKEPSEMTIGEAKDIAGMIARTYEIDCTYKNVFNFITHMELQRVYKENHK
jgi:hypothetical protein